MGCKMSIVRYFRLRFVIWVAILGMASVAYWLAIYVTRPIEYRKGGFREYETPEGLRAVQMPNFSVAWDPDCFSTAWPKHIVSPKWAAVQEIWLRGQCTVVVRSFTYHRGSAERVMQGWVSELTRDRSLLRERAMVSNHPALKLSAPGTVYLFCVWDDDTKLVELQAEGCRDEIQQQCLSKLIDSLELR